MLTAARDCFPNLKILMLKGQFFRPFYVRSMQCQQLNDLHNSF